MKIGDSDVPDIQNIYYNNYLSYSKLRPFSFSTLLTYICRVNYIGRDKPSNKILNPHIGKVYYFDNDKKSFLDKILHLQKIVIKKGTIEQTKGDIQNINEELKLPDVQVKSYPDEEGWNTINESDWDEEEYITKLDKYIKKKEQQEGIIFTEKEGGINITRVKNLLSSLFEKVDEDMERASTVHDRVAVWSTADKNIYSELRADINADIQYIEHYKIKDFDSLRLKDVMEFIIKDAFTIKETRKTYLEINCKSKVPDSTPAKYEWNIDKFYLKYCPNIPINKIDEYFLKHYISYGNQYELFEGINS